MNYCFVDAQKDTNSKLSNLVQKKHLTPIDTLKIEYNNYKQARQQIKDSKNLLKNQNTALFIENIKIDDQLPQFIKETKKEIDIIIAQGGLNKINRFLLEKTSIDYIADPHSSKDKLKKDFIHHFNSGINHVLATQAKEKKIGLFISLHQFSQKKKNLAKDIGRIQQNIRLWRKYESPILTDYIIEKPSQIKTEFDKKHILLFLSATPQQAHKSSIQLQDKITKNKEKNSKNYITEGLYIID